VVVIKQKNAGWLQKLLKRYRNESELAVGWPTGTDATSVKYPDGTPVVLVAAVNNFGSQSRGIPARPFMTKGQQPAIERTAPIAQRLVPKINAGKATIEDVLEVMGPFAVGEFQEAITGATYAPNAPETVKKKGSSKPLIDTGLMRQSMTYVVRKPR
jgi:hypothetical protein